MRPSKPLFLEEDEKLLDDGLPNGIEALWLLPPKAWCVLVLGHGAGAGMRHPFMADLAQRLAAVGIGTLRYQFPYMQAGKKRPDPPQLLERTVLTAIEAAQERLPNLPLFAGGKSMGGRMSSQTAAKNEIPALRGLVFVGFPLHPAKEPAIKRAEHLPAVKKPMLFLQGTRDALAELPLIKSVVKDLGSSAEIEIIDGADHGFAVLKSSGRDNESVMQQLTERTLAFCKRLAAER